MMAVLCCLKDREPYPLIMKEESEQQQGDMLGAQDGLWAPVPSLSLMA